MLRIIAGKARSGKTSLINAEIKYAVSKGQGGRFLLVPEQYSHEAERELCRICGDSLSLYAEVLSFTGLARKITAELGGIAVPYLDEGGRILCMAQALKMSLSVTRARKRKNRYCNKCFFVLCEKVNAFLLERWYNF